MGDGCANALTSGSSNIFLGRQAGSLITTGTGNFLCGDASLNAVLKGTTTSTGLYAFGASTGTLFLHNWGGAASGNTFVGYGSGSSFNAGQQASNKNNTGCGKNSLTALTTGSNNTVLGIGAGTSVTTGSNNTLIGLTTGVNYTSSESNNILINAPGVIAESNVLRIGLSTGAGTGQLNKSFISGIRGITTANANAIPVVIDSAGQLGTAGGVSFISTLTGNTGGAVSSSGGNILIVGDGVTANVVGNPGLNKLTISAIGGGGGSAGNPSFFAYLSAPVLNVTGDGTTYTIAYNTLAYNLGGAYNLGTLTFTAPATGLYNFSFGAFFTSLVPANSSGAISLSLTGFAAVKGLEGNYGAMRSLIGSRPNSVLAVGNQYVNMTAGDTMQATVVVSGATKTVGIYGSGVLLSTYLVECEYHK